MYIIVYKYYLKLLNLNENLYLASKHISLLHNQRVLKSHN